MSPPFSQQGETFEFDALVIGTGLAGLHYCKQLLEHAPHVNIALISKANAEESNSHYAQGGIAAVFLPEDSLDSHIEDTLLAGDGLCYQPSVERIIRQGPEAIRQLQRYEIQFDKTSDGRYALAKEGGHSHRRIFNCGDRTGMSTTNALLHSVKQEPHITCFENHIAVNLIARYHPHQTENQGEILGAYVLDCEQNRIHTFLARCVVLATGGAGKTFRYTSNPMVATGDGLAMAYRAGARVGNMEFYQFHPTLLHHHTLNNFLISEAIRGEGGLLKNADTYERFMHRYAPDKLELATRDVVSRAIFSEIEQSQHGFVYLDITHQSKGFLTKRFPNIYNTLAAIGIDMSQDMIPVVPAAHYQCGGVLTDVQGQTDLKRLYAIGEVAFTGLHGANRLASNSLLEAVVMASNAARASLSDLNQPWTATEPIPNWNSPSEVNTRRASQINAHWRSLRGEMTSYAGIVRTEDGLEDLLQLIIKRKKIIEEYYWNHCITRDFIELRNIILNAELIVRAALIRRESRGGHYREDYPYKSAHTQESISRLNSPQFPFL
ncbi:L-aspartate oxidase [Legionella yabuuchiae]|uniref:L-aspartate oxidase n=1 Tax=Legionella yabuuchiae TaxID=376727 RepID=UPI0010554924|nr:L-aspartate oxidase [Legionella yabuuchiae]